LTISREIGDPGGVARANFGLGDVARVRRAYAEADERYSQALATFRDLGDRVWIAFTLPQAAKVARQLGDRERAAALLAEAIAAEQRAGPRLPVAEALSHDGEIAWEDGDLKRATAQYQQSARVYWELGERLFFLVVLQALGCVAAERGMATAAATLLGAVDSALESRRPPRSFVTADDFARRLAALRDRLGEGAFADAWRHGQTLTLAETFAFATGPDFDAEEVGSPTKPPRSAGTDLTDREFEVLPLLVAGLTDREIAAALFISPRTVQVHVGRILTKLGVNSRTAAVAAAIRTGLVAPGGATSG
jgi:DNA-binding CsgD family transcriptional regulator/tetratricopeptide (TPR) repeat protein